MNKPNAASRNAGKMADPTFKQRSAYARAIRRGSRNRVTAEVFRATVNEAIAVVRPAVKFVKPVTMESMRESPEDHRKSVLPPTAEAAWRPPFAFSVGDL